MARQSGALTTQPCAEVGDQRQAQFLARGLPTDAVDQNVAGRHPATCDPGQRPSNRQRTAMIAAAATAALMKNPVKPDRRSIHPNTAAITMKAAICFRVSRSKIT